MSLPPLTRDRMRADVAKLIGEDPAAIRDDDNLMDLGVDSMRLLDLVLEWNERGVEVDFEDLAEDATIAGWWRAVEERRAAAAEYDDSDGA